MRLVPGIITAWLMAMPTMYSAMAIESHAWLNLMIGSPRMAVMRPNTNTPNELFSLTSVPFMPPPKFVLRSGPLEATNGLVPVKASSRVRMLVK